jgi:hypothetical protein
MAPTYHVQATWDAEAKVWTSQSDVPGLVIEAETLPEFEQLVRDLVPELLAEGDGHDAGARIELTSSQTFAVEHA